MLTDSQKRNLVIFYLFPDKQAKAVNGNALGGLVNAGMIKTGGAYTITKLGTDTARQILHERLEAVSGKGIFAEPWSD